MRQSSRLLLTVAAVLSGEHEAAAGNCQGLIRVGGRGAVSLVGARYNVPGDRASDFGVGVQPDGSIQPGLKTRSYFGDSCQEGEYHNTEYAAIPLLGQRLRYTVDLSDAGCGCNVAFYLVSQRQNTQPSQCGDYYCDANSVCGVACAEIDIQEANRHAFHSTLHSAADKDGLGKGIGGWNNEWSGADYGPEGRCVDTSMPFDVSAEFPVKGDGSLLALDLSLSQPGKPCQLTMRLDGYSYQSQDTMLELSKALAAGMTPVVSYWKSRDLLWLDGPGAGQTGPCVQDTQNCGANVRFSNFLVQSLPGPPPMTVPPSTHPPVQPPPPMPPTTTAPPMTTWRRPLAQPQAFLPTRRPPVTTLQPEAAHAGAGGNPFLPTRRPPATTWQPEASRGGGGGGLCEYETVSGKLAPGEFDVGTDGCRGVGECQFKTLAETQSFCDKHEKCTAVVLHPYSNNCAGGFGCYTPRYGEVSYNGLMDRIGGKGWVKQPCSLAREFGANGSPYVFAGFHSPQEARRVCSRYGKMAMPKTPKELELLETAIYETFAAGKMSQTWPKNTVWLGGQWRQSAKRWEWDDGTSITGLTWAHGQPNAKEQQDEPYLSMLLDGEVHDADDRSEFGVMCEASGSHRMLEPDAEVLPNAAPPAPPVPASAPPAGGEPPARQTYELGGFAPRSAVRGLCRNGGRLAMPRTETASRELQEALDAAVAAGKLSSAWPNNTIWLGGHWNSGMRKWMWDDGSVAQGLRWAPGQPSAAKDQDRERFLCMTLDGHVHDSDAHFEFAVMCEHDAAPEAVLLRSMLDGTTPAPLPQVAWVKSAAQASCHEACEGLGGCDEEAWPRSADEFASVAAQTKSSCAATQEGSHRYDPSISGRYCGWKGPGALSAFYKERCGARSPYGAQRFCPCRGGQSEATSQIWT